MGNCKDELKAKDDKTVSLFNRFKKKDTQNTNKNKAMNLADHLQRSDEKLDDLIKTKQAELKAESGREGYNKKALSYLETMRFHLDGVINTAADYGSLK